MSNELTLSVVQSQLTKAQKLTVDEGTIEEINKLANEPDYGPEFLSSYMDHMQVLADAPRNNHTQYLNAIKFFSLVEAENTLTDAYVKVFPERFDKRQAGNRGKTSDEVKQLLRGEASRYNGSKLISEIRRVATIPVNLIHRHLLNESILVTAELMRSARSEMVKAKAAEVLIRELKPTEDAVLEIKVDDGSLSVIESLRLATQELAAKQHGSVLGGASTVKEIAQSKIMIDQEDIVEGEFTEEYQDPDKKPWKLGDND
jgi:hypothetical protein